MLGDRSWPVAAVMRTAGALASSRLTSPVNSGGGIRQIRRGSFWEKLAE